MHLILKCLNPMTKEVTECHLASPPAPPNDKLPHVYTMVLSHKDDRRVPLKGWELQMEPARWLLTRLPGCLAACLAGCLANWLHAWLAGGLVLVRLGVYSTMHCVHSKVFLLLKVFVTACHGCACTSRYQVLIDGEEKAAGSLLDEKAFEPPLQPPKELPDPDDVKPEDWDAQEE